MLGEWVKRHQVGAFFILTFVISWGLWIPFVPMVFGRGVTALVPLALAGVFGPALAGIIISRLADPSPRLGRRKGRFLAFLMAWLMAAAVAALCWAEEGLSSVESMAIAAVTALVPAFIVSSAFSTVPGIRSYLESLVRPRGSVLWYLIAVVIFPGVISLSIAITRLLGGEIPLPLNPVAHAGELAVVVALNSWYRFFFGNAVGEEVGWRGFALPRLQARYNPIVACLILALPWFIWHFPLPQSQGFLSNLELTALVDAYWSFFLNSIIIAWLFNRTGGSILVAGLCHVGYNISVMFMPVPDAWDFVRPAFCLLIIVIDQMWRKLPLESIPV